MTKMCRRCSLELSLDRFSRDQKSTSGVMSWCKSCVSENRKEWRASKGREVGVRVRTTDKRTYDSAWAFFSRNGIEISSFANLFKLKTCHLKMIRVLKIVQDSRKP